VLRRRRAATSVAGVRARLKSGRSSPVCSVRSQLLRSAGRLLLPCDGPRVERGTWRAGCHADLPGAGRAAHCSEDHQQLAGLEYLQPDQDAFGRAHPRAVRSSLRLSCAKKNCELPGLTSLCSCERDCRVAGGGPTSAPSAPPQYEGAPNLATAKYRRRCTHFFVAHSPFVQRGASLLSIRHSSAVKK
jgi:hypothetical protein